MLISANAEKKGPHWNGSLLEPSALVSNLCSFQQMTDQIAEAATFKVCTPLQVLAKAPVESCGYALGLPRKQAQTRR
jgi:hypothetical protein